MPTFTTILKRFEENSEKTRWTYIDVPSQVINEIKPNQKTIFRVRGFIDQHPIERVALLPMGKGVFILGVNAVMRRAIRKEKGATVQVTLELDESVVPLSADLLACLEDDPTANAHFQSLSRGHQNYFSNWIEEAKTIETKTKRLTQAVMGLSMKMNFGEMIRHFKKSEPGFTD